MQIAKRLVSIASIEVLEIKVKMDNEAKKHVNHFQLLDHQNEFNVLFHKDIYMIQIMNMNIMK